MADNRRDWWSYGALADQAVGSKMLNLAVNWQRYGGHGPAIHVLQQAVASLGGRVDDDGSFGPLTVNAANALDPAALLDAIRQKALARYKAIEVAHPEDAEFFGGWEKRALA